MAEWRNACRRSPEQAEEPYGVMVSVYAASTSAVKVSSASSPSVMETRDWRLRDQKARMSGLVMRNRRALRSSGSSIVCVS